jgi:thioredoxin 2
MADVDLDDRGLVVACAACGKKNRVTYETLGTPVRCGQCKEPVPALGVPVELHQTADFDRLISKSSLPVVVDYWAPWCGPCRMVAPELQKVATRQAGRMIVVKGQRFNIRSIPTLAVFANGRELARSSGARPANEIEAWVQQATQAAKV